MLGTHNKAQLPTNPTLKEINRYKKQINLGELPAFYQLVASSISEADGLFVHGFDNAIKRITNNSNWNFTLLNAYTDDYNVIHCDSKPRIALHQTFSEQGYQLWAQPFKGDVQVDKYTQNHKQVEFRVWDPSTMKNLVNLNQLHKFIAFYFKWGDVADKALILHARKVIHVILSFLRRELNVVSLDGVSIKQLYQLCENESRVSNCEINISKFILSE